MEISSSLSLFLPEAAAPLWGAETGWVQSSAAAPEFFPNFLDAVESLPPLFSSVTKHGTNPASATSPGCACGSSIVEFTRIYLLMTLFSVPGLWNSFLENEEFLPGIHQNLPVNDPFFSVLA